MAYRAGRCTNDLYCSLASGKQNLQIPVDSLFVCPQCGKPLTAPSADKRSFSTPALLAVGLRDAQSSCLVEQAVNHALGAAYAEAEGLLVARLHGVKLSVLAEDFHRGMQARGLSLEDFHHEL